MLSTPKPDELPVAPKPPVDSSSSTSEEPYSIFDKRQIALIVTLVSVAATFSGFASNIYFPALPTIAHDLDVSIELINLTVTSYLIFQGLAPSLWGSISDVKGRRVAYSLTFIVFLGACIGLAEVKNYATMVVLRCIQSTGSAGTIAIGSGVIGDITTRDNRGGLMGIFQAGLLVPVAVGPIIGGALAGPLGWRSIFWFLVIYSGIFLICLALLLPETLRSIVGNGGRTPTQVMAKYPLRLYQKTTTTEWNRNGHPAVPIAKKHIDITGPFRILISKQAAPIIDKYDLSETKIGLTFIANGVGSMIGTMVTGKMLNKDFRRVKARYETQSALSNVEGDIEATDAQKAQEGDFPLETARLRLVPLFSLLQCASILLFGWTIQYPHKVHIAVPIVSTFITGWTAVSTQSVVMTYLVDVYRDRSAAASASLNLARCLFAAGGTSFVMPMINSIGVGFAFTVCVAVQAAAMISLAIQWKFGKRWRLEAENKRSKTSL
ncbi:major facilitator superfamily domain-containing protein [Fusarium venenatum]|uniref:major facilitator superfamily domain-containing protein n=1 Tax=Fusarium venenatum TaxID=56646 RepID=UPI001D49F777|nr:major facilitator superfamily domain-containing protein [Fusarium venenatum]